ncbi:zinc finger protein DZIP1L [Drosophila busckii]|uniref:zinc finger protein DZIP1L n=1 Tax=Drosophila busckii TaxID=30019 RepID=UPI001432932A|nr:zinc finger protein DZIP1L [Drosophila busckii]
MGYKGNFPQLMRAAGFKLRQYRDGPLDWRQMGSYEVDRILREQNFELVDEALQHLSEAPLGTVLEAHILDSGIAKYFIMSQYAIQYLLCCRTYLDESVGELSEAHATAQQEIANLRHSLSESNNEVVQLHKRITQIEAIREVVYPCHLCTKNFISNEALNIHITRKHHVGAPTGVATVVARDKDNDVQLINTIKMELEIKQLKERLNAAERNIKERSSGSKQQSVSQSQSRQDQATATISMRNVAIQSNLAEYKEKDELNIGQDSDASERKEVLNGLVERLSSFEAWQAQLKASNDQFIEDINERLEGLTHALELTKRHAEKKETAITHVDPQERVSTPCLEDLERILSEKVAEIGKVSADKLEEVVNHLELDYKEKLEALERELRRLNMPKEQATSSSASKIPKPLPKKSETSMERIKRQVENEFLQSTRDDDTYSIELPQQEQSTPMQSTSKPSTSKQSTPMQSTSKPSLIQVQELTNGSSSSNSHPTFTKPAAEPKPKAKPSVSQIDTQETTDISQSLSEEEEEEEVAEEEDAEEQGSEPLTSEPEREVFRLPKIKPTSSSSKSSPKSLPPLTRKDARKMVNSKLNPHGFNIKTKHITNASLKRINVDLMQHRNKMKLQYPNFYATRNRIRKFVEKLCTTKPTRAQELLKHKEPLQPMEVPKNEANLLATTEDDGITSEDDQLSATSEQSHSSSPLPQADFKAHLEQMLAKPVARLPVRPSTSRLQSQQAKPVPQPRKRVMFSGKSFEDDELEIK